ncbi:MAG: GNAT family N-acetyltransferase [Burkholderiaceae bacterium]
MGEIDYVTRHFTSPLEVDAAQWDALLAHAPEANPFMRHGYLAAMLQSGSACAGTGWQAHCITLWRGDQLEAACIVYLKAHSYGEYVFDWAWANAYAQHGLAYYPKALVAVPFTPVPGVRLLASTPAARRALLGALLAWCQARKLSSLHLLFCSDEDVAAATDANLMLRHTVQFHWKNVAPRLPAARGSLPPEGARFPLGRPGGETSKFTDFDHFLASLSQEKRKKIRQERRKVAEAGVTFRWAVGTDITPADWDFFYRCYERTYLEHGNAPYLSRDFFTRMQNAMPQHWLLFVAERDGRPIASSLIAITARNTVATTQNDLNNGSEPPPEVAYGRYWGALERVDCLHFEACYYQPLAWCIERGYQRFEGGAQGEHKMARALLPVKTTSAHWLAHPAFADAVERFLAREGQGIENYLEHLDERNPFKRGGPCPTPD